MRVLVWVPPWPVHGDPKFFRNAFQKHLCQQANALVGFAEEISIAIPPHFCQDVAVLDASLKVLEIPHHVSRNRTTSNKPLYEALYTQSEGNLANKLTDTL